MCTDAKAESRPSESELIYVPRDEEFDDIKRQYINQGKLKAVLRNIVLALRYKIMGNEVISNIDRFIQKPTEHYVPKSLLNLGVTIEQFFKFDPPKTFSSGKSQILSDDEFGRQVLAGLNPLSIERLKVFPPVSKLDPSIYGSVESALKEEHIINHIEGMSIQQALEENKLFILDYHDVYLLFLDRINALDERKAYATTTIFFLAKMGTLKPIAIVFKLLHPHMRYTLKTNATAREVLINAEGSIEKNYTPGRYCMQITCAAYKDWWRFDMEGLPADLIRR
ncbi:hypothetical protein TSUD_86400 [Trifolium subterraneum]|uniref:Lipoxygenase domain-containing protein n=1 Tax=Trifolium subterraneum TaxID=3900 RepID=A0A2Z6NV57_TRISU|nr:hypothetical protein TSUD_86400 [Trifolium subterraneum]